ISDGDINITATNDGAGGDNIIVEALTLASLPLVLQAAGNITLTAGNNITINGPATGAPVGALLQAGGKITLTTPAKDGSGEGQDGNGGDQKFIVNGTTTVAFNPAAPGVIDTATNTILLPTGNGLATGDAVQYETE